MVQNIKEYYRQVQEDICTVFKKVDPSEKTGKKKQKNKSKKKEISKQDYKLINQDLI